MSIPFWGFFCDVVSFTFWLMTSREIFIGGWLTFDSVLEVAQSLKRWLSYVALVSCTSRECLEDGFLDGRCTYLGRRVL